MWKGLPLPAMPSSTSKAIHMAKKKKKNVPLKSVLAGVIHEPSVVLNPCDHQMPLAYE